MDLSLTAQAYNSKSQNSDLQGHEEEALFKPPSNHAFVVTTQEKPSTSQLSIAMKGLCFYSAREIGCVLKTTTQYPPTFTPVNLTTAVGKKRGLYI